jgi:hypothetical protein
MSGIDNIQQSQSIIDQQRLEEIAGAGAAPNYLATDAIITTDNPAVDSTGISAPRPTPNPDPNPNPRVGDDDPNYVDNSNDYNAAIDMLGEIDAENDSDIIGFRDEHFRHWVGSADKGYWEPDADAIFQWQKHLMERANVEGALLIALSSRDDARAIVQEIMSGRQPEKNGKGSSKQVYARHIAMLAKVGRTALSKLLEWVNSTNKRLYEQRMEQARATSEGSEASVENFFTGGEADMRAATRQHEATMQYLSTTRRTLESMQQMIRNMVSWLVSIAGDDISLLGTIGQLNKFNDRIGELNTEVDRKMTEAQNRFDDMERNRPSGWWGILNAITIVGAIIQYGVAESEENYGDKAEVMSQVNMEQMIAEYRGSITAYQNGLRINTSLQLFRQDLINTVRQEMTGLSGVESDAEIVMNSVETGAGLTTAIFDMTASQLMIKTQLHNNDVNLLKSIQQNRKSQGIRVLSLGISLALLVLSIVITVVTYGGGAILIPAAIAAGVAIIKAGVDTYATYVANNIQSYEPHHPEYSAHRLSNGPTGNDVLDALNDVESNSENNLAASTNADNALTRTRDRHWAFDSVRFATYEIRQNIYDNSIRSIFSVVKHARDLRRVVRAELTGRSAVDSGESLLDNVVENIIAQRQMILSAIKFQMNWPWIRPGGIF